MSARVRSRGEGSISKRKDGRYEIRVPLGVENGKRKRLHLYAKTRGEAVRLLSQARSEHKPGRAVAGKTGETVEHFLNRWLESHVAKTKRARTLAGYEQNVRLHISPVIGKVRLTELTPEHVDAVTNAATAKGLSSTTVRLVRITLGIALNRAMKWRMPGVENVVRLTDAPKVVKKETEYLDTEQARIFLRAVKGRRLEAFYLVALHGGLRVGELQALRWQDVDMEKRQVRVAHSLLSGVKGLEEPKTKSSYRAVDLPASVVSVLKEHRLRQIADQVEAGAKGIPWLNQWGLVFTGQYGSPTCRTALSEDFADVLLSAALPKLRLHDLRHSYATLQLAAGVSPKVVQENLGHSKISTTLDLYAHVMPSSRREAAEALERLLA